MWTRTRATELFGIEYPILQGPFGAGFASAALVAAVSNAGGLGGFGVAGLSPSEIRSTAAAVVSLTPRPFGLNLWVPMPGEEVSTLAPEDVARSVARLAPYFAELGLAPPAGPLPAREFDFTAQVEAVLEARPRVFSFIMGVPDPAIVRAATSRGIVCVGTATTVDEAVALEESGVAAIVASGTDAGGHRGSFLRPSEQSLVGTMSLVPQVVSAVGVPVLAAGGIADGRGIAAALCLGAEGVQIGTAFLASPEAPATAVHKALLGHPGSRVTRLTRAYSGRPARGIGNAFIDAMSEHEGDVLGYPAQSILTLPLRRAAAQAERADILSMWAGQNAASARALGAGDLVRLLVTETDQVLGAGRLRPRS